MSQQSTTAPTGNTTQTENTTDENMEFTIVELILGVIFGTTLVWDLCKECFIFGLKVWYIYFLWWYMPSKYGTIEEYCGSIVVVIIWFVNNILRLNEICKLFFKTESNS